MTLESIAINGVPIEAYGVEPIDLAGWLRPPTTRYSSVQSVGRRGSRPSTRGAVYEPRTLTLGVRTNNASSSTLVAGRETLGAWHYALQGLLEIETVDAPGKVCYGLFEGAADDTFGIKLLSGQVESIGQIVCRDPLWYDRSPIVTSGGAGVRVPVPFGTATGRNRFMLLPTSTAPVVTVRSRTGEIVGQMRFDQDDFALTSADVLQVDYDQPMPIQKVTAGVGADAFDALNPNDGEIVLMEGDTMEVDEGGLVLTSWRGWLS